MASVFSILELAGEFLGGVSDKVSGEVSGEVLVKVSGEVSREDSGASSEIDFCKFLQI